MRTRLAFGRITAPLLIVFSLGVLSAEGAQKKADEKTATPTQDTSQYVGAETCKTCHEDIYNGWEKTPHWKTTLNKEGGPSKQGCEGCHGPGAATRGRRRRRHKDLPLQECFRRRQLTIAV